MAILQIWNVPHGATMITVVTTTTRSQGDAIGTWCRTWVQNLFGVTGIRTNQLSVNFLNLLIAETVNGEFRNCPTVTMLHLRCVPLSQSHLVNEPKDYGMNGPNPFVPLGVDHLSFVTSIHGFLLMFHILYKREGMVCSVLWKVMDSYLEVFFVIDLRKMNKLG